ncbi:MAG: hypothetical protein PVG20_00270 [Thioalkalispiraceae bacterium]|jgi:hypothetical protein
MNIRLTITLLFVMLVGACSTTNTSQTPKQINIECGLEMQAARTAVRLRDKGKPKSSLLAQLAPVTEESSRLLVEMHEITHEVYAVTELNEVIYPTYRYNLCQRELLHKPVPTSIELVLPLLLDCQRKHQDKSSQQSTRCIQMAIENSAEKHQQTDTEINNATNH